MNTEQYIQRMREDMKLRRLAESTQGVYERAIRLFLKHAGRQGQINCIIVKDMSHFGRDYLTVGNYISKVFPLLQ